MNKRRIVVIGIVVIALLGFFSWRFLRPMNIFIVEEKFAWPIDTTQAPALLGNLGAEVCGSCHSAFFNEWKSTIHSQAWTDPYFQVDWQFDDKQHICRLCHTPLDRQQPHTVLGYRDKNKWDPILEDNPEFDIKLQHEGVTCAACHYRDGKIIGVLGNTSTPHPVEKIDDPNQVCTRCHVVDAEGWGVFVRFPPCGTVAEIERSAGNAPAPQSLKRPQVGRSGEIKVSETSALGCVGCHMPVIDRPLVPGGVVRRTRQHLWRGGHNPEMVKKAFTARLVEEPSPGSGKRAFKFTLVNVGAAHYLPTGTPDRFLTVRLAVFDKEGRIIKELKDTLKRTVLWRPFIIDLWDTRLQRWQPKIYQLEVADTGNAAVVEATVRYYLVNEKRRKRIGYENKEPVSYQVFQERLPLEVTLKKVDQ